MIRLSFIMTTLHLLVFAPMLLAVEKDTIHDVWYRHGGARLYYDALTTSQQMYLNGARRQDPAYFMRMPPLHPAPRDARRAARPSAPEVSAKPQAAASSSAVNGNVPVAGVVQGTSSAAIARPGGETAVVPTKH